MGVTASTAQIENGARLRGARDFPSDAADDLRPTLRRAAHWSRPASRPGGWSHPRSPCAARPRQARPRRSPWGSARRRAPPRPTGPWESAEALAGDDAEVARSRGETAEAEGVVEPELPLFDVEQSAVRPSARHCRGNRGRRSRTGSRNSAYAASALHFRDVIRRVGENGWRRVNGVVHVERARRDRAEILGGSMSISARRSSSEGLIICPVTGSARGLPVSGSTFGPIPVVVSISAWQRARIPAIASANTLTSAVERQVLTSRA